MGAGAVTFIKDRARAVHFAECAARLPQSGYLAHFAPILQKKTKLPEIFYRKRAIIAAAEFRGAFYMETFFSRAADFLNGIVSPVKDAVYLALLFAPLAAAGIAAIACAGKIEGRPPVAWDATTVSGALCLHISTPNPDFQPMNANYGILAPLFEQARDKALKKKMFAERALLRIGEIAKEEFNHGSAEMPK